jgi:hypothetical protein
MFLFSRRLGSRRFVRTADDRDTDLGKGVLAMYRNELVRKPTFGVGAREVSYGVGVGQRAPPLIAIEALLGSAPKATHCSLHVEVIERGSVPAASAGHRRLDRDPVAIRKQRRHEHGVHTVQFVAVGALRSITQRDVAAPRAYPLLAARYRDAPG